MKAMILAAGFGKRMQPLTLKTPKPLLEVVGKPLIVHHIERLVATGIHEIVINVSYLGEQIMSYLGDGRHYGASIQYSIEQAPLEVGGGIVKALPLLGKSRFVCVNGDVWTDYPFHHLVGIDKLSQEHQNLAHLILVDNPQHHPEGDFCLDTAASLFSLPDALPERGGACVGEDAKRQDPVQCYAIRSKGSQQLTYSGISLFDPKLFLGCDESIGRLAPLLRKNIEQGKVSGEYFQGEWSDVGSPERLAQINRGSATTGQ